MNPIDDLIALLAKNPNISDAALLKAYPQLNGLTTKARAMQLGLTRGMVKEEIEYTFPELYSALVPKPAPQKTGIDAIPSKPAIPTPKPKKEKVVDENDPLGTHFKSITEELQETSLQRSEQRFQRQFSDNVRIVRPKEIDDARSQEVTKLANKEQALREEKKLVQSTPAPMHIAKEGLGKLIGQNPDYLSIEQIEKLIPDNKFGQKNETGLWMLSKYKDHRAVAEAVQNAPTFQKAAINFAYYNQPEKYKELTNAFGTDPTKFPPSVMATMLQQFYVNPAFQEWVNGNDSRKQAFDKAKGQFFVKYPAYGRKWIGEVMAEGRAEKGWNNALVNVIDDTDGERVTANDKLFKEMVESGRLPPEAEALYKQMRGKIDQYIPTPGIVESILNGAAEMGLNMLGTFIDSRNGTKGTYNAYERAYSQITPQFKGWQNLTHSTGKFSGEMLAIAALGRGLSGAGLSSNAANALSIGIAFEKPNRERAAMLYPNDTAAQTAYTGASTLIDVLVGKLYHRGKSVNALQLEAKEQLAKSVKAYSAGEIERTVLHAQTKQTVTEFLTKAGQFAHRTFNENVKQSAQMGGFTLAHNTLDYLLGKREDIGAGEVAESVTHAFLSGGLVSAMAAKGQNKKAQELTASGLWEIAKRPERVRDAMERSTELSVDEYKIRKEVLEQASSVVADLGNFEKLSQVEKETLLLHEVHQFHLTKKLEAATSQTLKDQLQREFQVSRETVQEILTKKGYVPEMGTSEKKETPKKEEILTPSVSTEGIKVEETKEVKEPEVQEAEYVSSYPQPKKHIGEMSSTELREYSDEIKNYENNIEVTFFGEEGAQAYRKARNISWNDHKYSAEEVREADQIMKKMEGSLSKSQYNEFFGIEQHDILSREEVRSMEEKVRFIEESDTAAELASTLKNPLLTLINKPKDAVALTTLAAAKRRMKELGLPERDVVKAALSKLQAEFSDPIDAEMMLEKYLRRPEPSASNKEVSKTLEAPKVLYQTKSGKYQVFNENGKRVVKDKEGKEVPAIIPDKANPEKTIVNPLHTSILRAHDKTADYKVGERAPEPEGVDTHIDYQRARIEKTTSPIELAEIYMETPKETESLTFAEEAIADHGIGKITEESFAMFGDRNNINDAMARTYLKKEGLSIDQIAKEISDHNGIEVTPDDIVSFISRFPYGAEQARRGKDGPIRQEAAARFEQLTGIRLSPRVAEQAIKQGRNAEQIAQAQINAGHKVETEPLPKEELLKWLEEESKVEKDEENIDTLEYEENITDSSGENGSRPGTEASLPSDPGRTTPEGSGESIRQDGNERTGGDASTGGRVENFDEAFSTGKYTGRIAPEPIKGEVKQLSKILADAGKGLNQKLIYANPSKGSRRALGSYNASNKGIKIKLTNDLDTTAHEIGHALDDQFRVMDEIQKDAMAEAELLHFSKFGSTPPKGHPDPKLYELGEGMAEFIRAFVVNPKEAQRLAPTVTSIYEKTVPEKVRKELESFSNDVRAWAGATGRDQILANIEVKPEKGTLLEKIVGEKKIGDFSITWFDRLSANFLNSNRIFEKAFRHLQGVKGVDEVLPSADPQILGRLLLGVDGKLSEMLQTGLVNAKNEVVRDPISGEPMTMRWLIEPLDKSTEGTVTREVEDTMALMVAERTLELSERFDREEILSGIGAGIYTDVAVAQKTIAEFQANPTKYQRVQEAARRYREFSTTILQYAVEKGRLSQETFEKIVSENSQYVAMRRILEAEPGTEISVSGRSGSKAIGSKSEPLNKIKGSARTIQNPYTSLLDTMYKTVRESDRNEVMKSFRDMMVESRKMYQGDTKRFSDLGVLGKQGDANSIPIFVDGKPEYWVFEKDLYASLKGLDNEHFKFLPFVTFHARALRWSVTNWPVFAVKNWLRDVQSRLIISNENKGLSGFTNLFGKGEDWNALSRAGGLNSGFYLKDRSHFYGLLKEAVSKVSQEKKSIVLDAFKLKNWGKKYQDLLFKAEKSNRVAEYRSAYQNARERGLSEYDASLYAAYKSREMLDFAVSGFYMKVINQIVPFSNAAVQGLRSSVIHAKENPVGFGARLMMYSIIPQAMLWYLNHRDEETAKEYESIPGYQRDLFWNFKMGDNKWYAIPKPYELSLFGAGVDRALSESFAGNKDAFSGYAGQVAQSAMPIAAQDLAGIMTPMLQASMNRDAFRDKSIIPQHEEALNMALRNTERASNLSKFLGENVGIDPRMIDFYLKAQFSYFGDFATKASNLTSDNKRQQQLGIKDVGLIKESPGYNAVEVQKLMDYAKEWGLSQRREYRTFTGLMEEYFESDNDTAKEALAKELREFAARLLDQWKAQKMDQRQLDKKSAKTSS